MREALLLALAEDYRKIPHGLPCIVLSGRNEVPDPTPTRWAYGQHFASRTMAEGAHTQAEAVWWRDTHHRFPVVVVTSLPHLLRAFLTWVTVSKDQRFYMAWPLGPVSSKDLSGLAEEAEKIRRYQGTGHVATVEEGLKYLDWRDG